MTRHTLAPSAATAIDVFDRDAPPVLSVDPGDTIVVASLDAHGFLDRPSAELKGPLLLPDSRGHCLTGPIEVRGAEPGSFLALHLEEIVPGDWGWTAAGGRTNWLEERLGVSGGDPARLLWSIDPEAGLAVDDDGGRRMPIAPFLGVMGLAPAEPGQHSTIPPRQGSGGNIDCRDLVAGSTLFLPVQAPGALLSLGDGHAAQGHGEVGGTAIECPMTTTLRVDVVAEAPVTGIHAETPAARLTFGFDEDLDEATAEALGAMLDWLEVLLGVDGREIGRREALALASAAVDLHVTQIANVTWGVHASLAHDRLAGLRGESTA